MTQRGPLITAYAQEVEYTTGTMLYQPRLIYTWLAPTLSLFKRRVSPLSGPTSSIDIPLPTGTTVVRLHFQQVASDPQLPHLQTPFETSHSHLKSTIMTQILSKPTSGHDDTTVIIITTSQPEDPPLNPPQSTGTNNNPTPNSTAGSTSHSQGATNISPSLLRWMQQGPREGTPSEYLGINTQQN